jgi:uncharacterized protein (DUF1697 family)
VAKENGMSDQVRYVALLRGINVGGHRKISKEQLTSIFERIGLSRVQTLLASGNVVFSSAEGDEAKLQTSIESALESELGYSVDVMVRTVEYICELLDLDPFAEYEPVGAKFYVTFLSRRPEEQPELPVRLTDQGSEAVGLNDREFFAVSYKNEGSYGDFSKYLQQTFGKQPVTTRNWNTIAKIAALKD